MTADDIALMTSNCERRDNLETRSGDFQIAVYFRSAAGKTPLLGKEGGSLSCACGSAERRPCQWNFPACGVWL